MADTNEDSLEMRLASATTLLSVDVACPGGLIVAQLMAETMLRLPGALRVSAPDAPAGFLNSLLALAEALDAEGQLHLDADKNAEITVHVHIGQSHRDADVCVVPAGYGVRLGSSGRDPLPLGPSPNAVGGLFTAATAVAEAFKYQAELPPAIAPRHDELEFCPASLSSDLSAAPDVQEGLALALALVGCGAIGTATAKLLSMLPVTGEIELVDPGRYAIENLGTYSLGTVGDARLHRHKVDLAAEVLTNFRTRPWPGDVASFIDAVDAENEDWPRVVLSGLDSPDARRDAQGLWPDHIIDAATGSTTTGIHHARALSGPCLGCMFPARVGERSGAEILAEATGLSRERAARGDDPLTDEDVAGLNAEMRSQLAPFVGRPVCGLATDLGLAGVGASDYAPAVPFVSQQAACLAVARVLVTDSGLSQPNFVQYDTLVGPCALTQEDRRETPDCPTHRRSGVIKRLREERGRHALHTLGRAAP